MPESRLHFQGACGLDPNYRFVRPSAAARKSPSDLILARQALDCQQFEAAEQHLRRALDADPESADAWTLMGVLHDRLGEPHAAYHCYKQALTIDRYDRTALARLRRYCERFGLDFRNRAINPSLD